MTQNSWAAQGSCHETAVCQEWLYRVCLHVPALGEQICPQNKPFRSFAFERGFFLLPFYPRNSSSASPSPGNSISKSQQLSSTASDS